jgi:hypothetical protein
MEISFSFSFELPELLSKIGFGVGHGGTCPEPAEGAVPLEAAKLVGFSLCAALNCCQPTGPLADSPGAVWRRRGRVRV